MIDGWMDEWRLPLLEVDVFASKQKPKKLTLRGSDGREYPFIAKGSEDLRQDDRIERLFRAMENGVKRFLHDRLSVMDELYDSNMLEHMRVLEEKEALNHALKAREAELAALREENLRLQAQLIHDLQVVDGRS